jgi:hypothetical protein
MTPYVCYRQKARVFIADRASVLKNALIKTTRKKTCTTVKKRALSYKKMSCEQTLIEMKD